MLCYVIKPGYFRLPFHSLIMQLHIWPLLSKYRIGSYWAPLLNTTPPNENANRPPVKNEYQNNRPPSRIDPHPRYQLLSFISTINGTKQYTCNNAHATKHMQQCACRHIIWQTNKRMCLVCFKEYQTNKVGTHSVWFIYAAVYDYTGVCVPTYITLVIFFPKLLGLINRTPSWL